MAFDINIVFDRKLLLYSFSEPATNKNLEEKLSGNSPRKKWVGKFRFSKVTSCSTRASNFILNLVFSILALLFSPISVTGGSFHFITQE